MTGWHYVSPNSRQHLRRAPGAAPLCRQFENPKLWVHLKHSRCPLCSGNANCSLRSRRQQVLMVPSNDEEEDWLLSRTSCGMRLKLHILCNELSSCRQAAVPMASPIPTIIPIFPDCQRRQAVQKSSNVKFQRLEKHKSCLPRLLNPLCTMDVDHFVNLSSH
jgi:hypothetical protein